MNKRTINVNLSFEIDVPEEDLDFYLNGEDAERSTCIWKYLEGRHIGSELAEDVRYMSLDVTYDIDEYDTVNCPGQKLDLTALAEGLVSQPTTDKIGFRMNLLECLDCASAEAMRLQDFPFVNVPTWSENGIAQAGAAYVFNKIDETDYGN